MLFTRTCYHDEYTDARLQAEKSMVGIKYLVILLSKKATDNAHLSTVIICYLHVYDENA